jgi:hypothetical protein
MPDDLTVPQRKLADEVTAAVTALPPKDLDGDSIVRVLYASKAGREALIGAGLEATVLHLTTALTDALTPPAPNRATRRAKKAT